MTYREDYISRTIYQIRHLWFRILYIKKKIKKVWRQRTKYFSRDYWVNRTQKKQPDSVKTISKVQTQTNDKCEYNYSELSDRLAVYTCIYGPYDLIREPLYTGKWCDYYIITDQHIPSTSKWKKIAPELPDGFSEWPDAVKNRYFKMHPERIFPNHRYSLYVDGNVWLLTDMYPFVLQLKDKFIGIFKYPLNDCFYLNAPFLESLGLVAKELSNKQVETYRDEGFPEHYGYFECSILLREHHHPQCVKLMNTWWEQYCIWVKRDQQCFPYSLWKNGFTKSAVACLGANLRKTERFTLRDHRKRHSLVEGGPQIRNNSVGK